MKKENLNPKQELFCQLYVNNRETFGNATLAYAQAYGLEAKIDGTEEQKSAYWSANACGSQLLVKPSIKSRVVKLLNNLLKDDIVDSELAKVITQDNELSSKVSAIREYNKLKQRIVDNINLNLVKPLPIGTQTKAKIKELYGIKRNNLRKDNGTAEDESRGSAGSD